MNIVKKITFLLAGVTLFVSANAFADKLDDAKLNGLIGENSNGYLGVVVSSPVIEALVKDINQKRKARYKQLANKNNLSLEQVEMLAAKKAYSKTAEGNFIWVDGKWVKK